MTYQMMCWLASMRERLNWAYRALSTFAAASPRTPGRRALRSLATTSTGSGRLLQASLTRS